MPAARREWLLADVPSPAERFPESLYFVAGDHLTEAAAADDPRALASTYLERHGLTRAILNPGAASSVSGYASPVVGSEMARAVNDWTIDKWLDANDRLLGSIVVSPRDPARAAAEIRRAGADERMAQVLLAYPQQLLGSRMLYPIYEAACELGLPVNLQAGGAYSGSNAGLTMVGDSASSFEALVSWEFAAQPHLSSMVVQGAFNRFPELRLVLSGFGVAWLPSLLWRLDHEYRVARAQPVPALAALPSELVRKHVRFTTSPLELPASIEQLVRLLSLVDGEQMLLYGSGALGADDPQALLAALDGTGRERVARQNAIAWYGRIEAAL